MGQNVTFTATVSPNTASGMVTFKDGSTTLGTGTLVGGVATFATTALSVATHSITAVYGGSASKSTSTSVALSQVVVNPVISIANGLWNANTTWDVNRIPVIGDIVVIDTPHTVTLSGSGNAKNLTTRGKLILSTVSSILRLGF